MSACLEYFFMNLFVNVQQWDILYCSTLVHKVEQSDGVFCNTFTCSSISPVAALCTRSIDGVALISFTHTDYIRFKHILVHYSREVIQHTNNSTLRAMPHFFSFTHLDTTIHSLTFLSFPLTCNSHASAFSLVAAFSLRAIGTSSAVRTPWSDSCHKMPVWNSSRLVKLSLFSTAARIASCGIRRQNHYDNWQ